MFCLIVDKDPSKWATGCRVSGGVHLGVQVWKVTGDQAFIMNKWRGQGADLYMGPEEGSPDVDGVLVSRSMLRDLQALAATGLKADLQASAMAVCDAAGLTPAKEVTRG
jgi:hypothetical protein